jgi:hypothetical protein
MSKPHSRSSHHQKCRASVESPSMSGSFGIERSPLVIALAEFHIDVICHNFERFEGDLTRLAWIGFGQPSSASLVSGSTSRAF